MWVSNGYLVEYYTDPNTGIRKRISVKLSGDSERAKDKAKKKLQDKLEHIEDKKIKLSECVRLWLKECERSVKPSTFRKYRITLDSIQKVLGDAYIDKITAGYVRQRFLDSGESNRTLNGYLKTFKTFWRWAYRNDFVKTPEVADKYFSKGSKIAISGHLQKVFKVFGMNYYSVIHSFTSYFLHARLDR